MEHIVSIILALLALLGGCGWFVSGRKYKGEVKQVMAEAERAELDLSAEYVRTFKEQIQKPLEDELHKLRQSIEKINRCKYRRQCPVARRLYQPANSCRAEGVAGGGGEPGVD